MEYEEFFEAIKGKQMKEVHVYVTFDCDCHLFYAPVTKETFGNPCPLHESIMSS